MAAALPIAIAPLPSRLPNEPNRLKIAEISGVFRGHELTRKDRRLSSGIASLDHLLAGGIARGRISEITGPSSSGKTSIAAAFAAQASRRGETVGWIDTEGAFDPTSIEAAGADLSRILWTTVPPQGTRTHSSSDRWSNGRRSKHSPALTAAELLLNAGGFGLIVLDFGQARYPLTQSAALRIARAAERSGAAMLALAHYRMCGTFAALTLAAKRSRTCFSRSAPGAPPLFDGIRIEASVARNKLGVFGHCVELLAVTEPCPAPPAMRGEGPGERFYASPFPNGEGGQEVRSGPHMVGTSPLTPLPSGEGNRNRPRYVKSLSTVGEDADVEDVAGNAVFN